MTNHSDNSEGDITAEAENENGRAHEDREARYGSRVRQEFRDGQRR